MKKTFIIIWIVILLGSITAGFGYILKMYLDSRSQLSALKTQMALGASPTPANESEIVNKVASHILLPDEEPKIITVQNVEELRKQQPFFEKAENGDKVLVFSQKVILYNPTLDKIIEIAQIRPDQGQNPIQVNPDATPSNIIQ